MKRWRSKLLLLGGVAALGLTIPAFSQESVPPPPPPEQSNVQLPLPQAAPPPQAQQAQPARPRPRPVGEPDNEIIDAAAADLEALLARIPPPIEVPEHARRPIEVVGPLGPENWGLGQGAFGNANGRFLSSLMRRLDAPLPSRWTSILLRRALLSRVPAPSYVHPVDWVAERAWLLLRMGEADAARMLVQSVDVDKFTPKMFSVAVQSALANADPAGLCPLVEPGRKTSDEPVWNLADAVCAAIEGNSSKAGTLIDQARRRGTARGADLLLAEKMIGAGMNSRRAVTVQWDEVDRLNSWRFGMAAATGAEIPERLLNSAGPQVRAWHARAPMVPIEQRIGSAQVAAALGVFSNASLVEMHSLIADGADVTEINQGVGGRLRVAYGARAMNARVEAIRDLWEEADNPTERYARHILTAVAASRIQPSEEAAGAAPELLASMLSAGMDRDAARWASVVNGMEGADQARAWALLAVAPPRPAVDATAAWFGRYRENDDSPGDYRSKLLFAALAGLDRLSASEQEGLARDMGIDLARENRWTRMLDAAVRARQPGTAALLAGIGMQTSDWRGVPPEHFYRIIRALRQVGLDYEARMIAAEAVGRT